MAVRKDQLERLGIALPPDSAWDVELSPRDIQILSLYLLSKAQVTNALKSTAMTTGSVATTVSDIVSASSSPRTVTIQNNSTTATVWLAIGVDPVIGTLGIRLGPLGYWESSWDFKAAVRAIASATASVTVLVGTR